MMIQIKDFVISLFSFAPNDFILFVGDTDVSKGKGTSEIM